MGSRMGEGGDIGPGRNGRHSGEPIPFWLELTSSALGLITIPPANGGHPIPGADTRSVTYSVDDVHQPGPDNGGRRGMGNDVWKR